MATAKHQVQKVVCNPANQKLVDFLDELQKLARDVFRRPAHAIIEQFKYARMSHLKKSRNQAHLENGTFEHTVHIASHLEKKLELNGLETPDEQQLKTVSQHYASKNANRRQRTCHLCRITGTSLALTLPAEKTEKAGSRQSNKCRKKRGAKNYFRLTIITTTVTTTTRKTVTEPKRKPTTDSPLCET